MMSMVVPSKLVNGIKEFIDLGSRLEFQAALKELLNLIKFERLKRKKGESKRGYKVRFQHERNHRQRIRRHVKSLDREKKGKTR